MPRLHSLLLATGLGLVAFSATPVSRVKQSRSDNVVFWRAHRPLRWADFRARTCPLPARAGERALGACVATAITVIPCADSKGRSTFLVDSYLTKSQSWVRDSTSYDTPLLLAHEQIHFDINELYARKIRALITGYYQARRYPYTAELHERIAFLLLEKTSYNNRFDAEVAADPIGGSVTKWQALVSQQLQALSPYTAGNCPCNL